MSETSPVHDQRYDPDWCDARQMREVFGVAPFHKIEALLEGYEEPLPNCVVHEADPQRYDHKGGTNALVLGEKGSGKSTLALWLAIHLMDVNDEAVIWRGSPERSEWLPLREWTTLCLPASCKPEATWKPRDIRAETSGEDVDLEDEVRDIVYYDGVEDLLSQLEPHQFHVVYPDPQFVGCNEVMSGTGYSPHDVQYVPQNGAGEDEEPTPLVHWWFALFAGRLEFGPYDWTTVLFDEAADLAPDDARADKAQHYEKVTGLRKVMADSRKYYLSLFWFAHHEQNLHSKIRRTMQWRVSMPDGTSNPRQENDSPPLGFNSIPMRYDLLSSKDVGHGIWWTERNFTRFKWDDVPVGPVDENRWLKISLEPQTSRNSASRARLKESHGHTRGAGDD